MGIHPFALSSQIQLLDLIHMLWCLAFYGNWFLIWLVYTQINTYLSIQSPPVTWISFQISVYKITHHVYFRKARIVYLWFILFTFDKVSFLLNSYYWLFLWQSIHPLILHSNRASFPNICRKSFHNCILQGMSLTCRLLTVQTKILTNTTDKLIYKVKCFIIYHSLLH